MLQGGSELKASWMGFWVLLTACQLVEPVTGVLEIEGADKFLN